MPVVERSAMVMFTPAQMFALVDDVARYPEFMPWCNGARAEELSATERRATLKVARGILRSEFTTRNTVTRNASIDMTLEQGPFRHLTGQWKFEAIGDHGSRVSFRVEFDFKSSLASAAFNTVFQSLCASIVDSFVKRAQATYR